METRPPHRPARAAFETKVIQLETWAKNGHVPDDAPNLDTINQVRLWEDSSRGIASWTSFSIAAPAGPNADLRARLDSVLPLIGRLRGAENGSVASNSARRKAISQIQVERERDRLAIQNEYLLGQQEKIQNEVARLRQLLIEKDRIHKDLLEKFQKIVPFGGG